MPVKLALPCRITVFEEEGKVRIGMITPTAMLSLSPHAAELKPVGEQVRAEARRTVDEAR
jgi:uncharacterized protein (DUF302 family)